MRTKAVSATTVFISLVIALLLDSLPWPPLLAGLRPQITLLVLFYWLLSPCTIRLTTVFMVGLCTDILTHALLGEHALAWILGCYLLVTCQRQWQGHHPLQQSVGLFCALLVSYGTLFCIQYLIHAQPLIHVYLYVICISLLFWPLVWVMLNRVERRYRYR